MVTEIRKVFNKNSLVRFMEISLFKEIVSSIAGSNATKIVDLLYQKKNVNEFLIAKKLKLTINQTRNVLYKLADNGLVSSTRKKDTRKGWYTYFWKIEILKSLEFLKNLLERKTADLRHQIKSRETKLFYICETCNVEYNEENAMLNNFTCSECGNVFSIKDNTKGLKDLKKELDNFENQMVLLNEEINKEKSKQGKKRMRVIKREKREKEKIAKEKRLIRKEEKLKMKKIDNKLGKKLKNKKIKKHKQEIKQKAKRYSKKKPRNKKRR